MQTGDKSWEAYEATDRPGPSGRDAAAAWWASKVELKGSCRRSVLDVV